MDISRNSAAPGSDDKSGTDQVPRRKQPKSPGVDYTSAVSAMTDAKATESPPEVAAPAGAEMPRVKAEPSTRGDSIQSMETPGAGTRREEEPDIASSLEKLEEKITQNIKEFRDVDAKIKETDEDLEEIAARKRKESLGEKAKKIALICPQICVEANVCRFPKALCNGCGKMVDVWKSASKAGAKALGELSGKCVDSLSTGMRLPIIRIKMNKDFKKLGDRAYQMYLTGTRDILDNEEIRKIIEEVQGYEKQIENLESHLTDLNGEPTARKQPA